MKAISVRLNVYQSNWLKAQAKAQDICAADYVRELIGKQMKEPNFFEYFKAVENKTLTTASEKRRLIYSLMSCKMLEQLVLNEENGQQKRDTAYNDTLERLEQLKVHPNEIKNCKICMLLYPEQLAWLKQQSKIFKKNIGIIIRKIVCLESTKALEKGSSLADNPNLTEVQQEEIKAILMTVTLLKTYIIDAYEDGEKLVKSCHESAQTLYNKLYSASCDS